MKKNWERLLRKVGKADMAVSEAVQAIDKVIVYKGFDYDDEPTLDMASSHELIISWHLAELFPEQFVAIMEEKGCIEPTDFAV